MPLRSLLPLLSLLLLLTACDLNSLNEDTLRISSLSTTTPSVGGELVIRGVGFSHTQPGAIRIGSQAVQAENISSWHNNEIKLSIAPGTPNGHITVTNESGKTTTFDKPLHVIASLQIDPLEANPGTRHYPVTARALDANNQPVPGATLLFDATNGGTFTQRLVTTDSTGTARTTIDLTGITQYSQVRVWAPPLRAFAEYKNPGEYDLGREVILTDGSTSMTVYLQNRSGSSWSASTLNQQQSAPPAPHTHHGPTVRPSSSMGEPTEIIVAYKPYLAASSTMRASALSAAGVQHATHVSGLDLARVPAGQSLEETLALLNADPRVAYAEPNYLLSLAALPNDPSFYRQWGAFAIGAPNAWSASRGDGIVVAVLDTAFDLQHPDLEDALVPGFDFCADNDDCLTYDDDPHADTVAAQHGTHVAAIIAATHRNGHGTAGIAPGARILPVKVFPEGEDKASILTISLAIRWAAGLSVDGVPANLNPARVINLSLGGPGDSQTLDNAINAAVAEGVVVVAAAGNEGENLVNHPARLPNVLGVGALSEGWEVAEYSNYGPGLDLIAPGTFIYAAKPGGDNHYMSGTSMATPHVAAAAALVLAENPNLSPAQVKSALKNSTYWPDGATFSHFGAGVLRADGALGLPTPTNDTDRYASVTIGGRTLTLDLREGTSTSVTITNPTYPLDVRLTHSGRELNGALAAP